MQEHIDRILYHIDMINTSVSLNKNDANRNMTLISYLISVTESLTELFLFMLALGKKTELLIIQEKR